MTTVFTTDNILKTGCIQRTYLYDTDERGYALVRTGQANQRWVAPGFWAYTEDTARAQLRKTTAARVQDIRNNLKALLELLQRFDAIEVRDAPKDEQAFGLEALL